MIYLLTSLQSKYDQRSIKKLIEWSIKIVVSMVCLYLIYRKIDLSGFHEIQNFAGLPLFMLLVPVLILMVVNWLLEAYRWKISLEHSIGFRESLHVVLRGAALNWVIPFTAGDAISRMSGSKEPKKNALAILINRSVMLSITTFYGAVAILFFLGYLNKSHLIDVLITVLIAFTLYICFEKRINRSGLSVKKIILISVIRYLVFTFQFYMLIQFFFPQLPVVVIALGVGWIFLFRSFIPALIGNFGVREASALLFFQGYTTEVNLILVPCLLIWVINTVLPSLLGLLSIHKLSVNIA